MNVELGASILYKQNTIGLRQPFAKSEQGFIRSEQNVVPNNIVVRKIILNNIINPRWHKFWLL